MASRCPGVVPTGIKCWFLFLRYPKIRFGISRIIIGCEIAGIRRECAGLKIEFVLGGNALLESQGKLTAFYVIVGLVSVAAFILRVEGIAEPAHTAEKCAGLDPIAATIILRQRTEPERTRLKKP